MDANGKAFWAEAHGNMKEFSFGLKTFVLVQSDTAVTAEDDKIDDTIRVPSIIDAKSDSNVPSNGQTMRNMPDGRRALYDMVTLEGVAHRILFNGDRGYKIYLNANPEQQQQQQQQQQVEGGTVQDKNIWFESMQALLTSISPLYVAAFHQKLFGRLSEIAQEQDDDQKD